MSTTSLKLPDELKRKAVAAAEKRGMSPHAFMISAIELATSAADQRAAFVAEAQAAHEQLVKTGKGYEASEVHAHLNARIAGMKTAKPKAKSWRS